MQPIVLVVASDTHVNSHVGLWTPNFIASGGNVIGQNKYQKWLWGCWLDYCDWVKQWKRRIVVLNGDPVQGIKYSKDVQILVQTEADQRRAAENVLEPLFDCRGVIDRYVVKGTEWHEGPSGKEIEELAKAMGARVNEGAAQNSHWLLSILLDSKLFAFAHHSSVTTVYHHTPAQRSMREAKEAFADDGTPIPDCFVRSHVHRFGITPDATGRRFYLTTPGWQLQNAHGYKFRPQVPPHIGGIVLWVEDGEVKYRLRKYTIPREVPFTYESSPSQSLA